MGSLLRTATRHLRLTPCLSFTCRHASSSLPQEELSHVASWPRAGVASSSNMTFNHGLWNSRVMIWRRGFASGEQPSHQVLSLPALSPTMAKGNIPTWNKKEGDKVTVGEVLCLIETDKSTMEMEAMEEGFLAKILVPAGSTDVPVGQPIAVIVENEEDIASMKDFSPSVSGSAKMDKSPTKEPASGSAKMDKIPTQESAGASADSQDSHPSWQRVGPAVRMLLNESGLDIASVKGTGPRGVVVKGDVLAAMKLVSKPKGKEPKVEGNSQPAAASLTPQPKSQAIPKPLSAVAYDDLPTSQIRKVIAKRLSESKKGVPHLYLSVDTTLDATLALRKELKEKYGVHVSVNDFVIKAVASALKAVPEANAHWNDKTGEVESGTSIDISVAVATEKGLMTPILRNADQKSLPDISSEVKLLAGKARDGKLAPHEFQGGTFSISNLGMFSVDQFCAIINPPQACILAVGRGEPVVVWEEDTNGLGKPQVATKITLTLSADNRVVDPEIGGRFLEKLAGIVKDPRKALL